MINIIIRTSYRPKAFGRCIASLMREFLESPLGSNVIVGYDNIKALEYIPDYCHKVDCRGLGSCNSTHRYNEYLNTLINHNRIQSGHILILDDDDELAPGSISKLLSILRNGYSYILPFLKANGVQKPFPNMIASQRIHKGYIGMPCLLLAVDHRHLVYFDGTEYSDYNAIKNINTQIKLLWSNLILVNVSARGNGKNEE